MHEYDIALKTFLREGTQSLLALTGLTIERWHNVELPEVRNRRVHQLGETEDGRLVHIELQSTNDADMALRMLEYYAAVYRQFGRYPEQVVLYVGEAPMRMSGRIETANLSFTCRMVDIRELDGDSLLESARIGDNIIAVLARVRDRRAAVREILNRIATEDPGERGKALTGFMMLAGLRRLEEIIEQEAGQMPLLDDILDNKVLGREFRRGREQGREHGLHDGELTVLLCLMEKRFGSVPPALRERLAAMPATELEAAALRFLDAGRAEDVLG